MGFVCLNPSYAQRRHISAEEKRRATLEPASRTDQAESKRRPYIMRAISPLKRLPSRLEVAYSFYRSMQRGGPSGYVIGNGCDMFRGGETGYGLSWREVMVSILQPENLDHLGEFVRGDFFP